MLKHCPIGKTYLVRVVAAPGKKWRPSSRSDGCGCVGGALSATPDELLACLTPLRDWKNELFFGALTEVALARYPSRARPSPSRTAIINSSSAAAASGLRRQ